MNEVQQSRRRVVFVCTANAIRSQIAEAVCRDMFGDEWDIASAGIYGGGGEIHPLSERIIRELGFDQGEFYSKGLHEIAGEQFDILVTMSEEARTHSCAPVSYRMRVHWEVRDPTVSPQSGDAERDRQGGQLESFRALKREIAEKMASLQGI